MGKRRNLNAHKHLILDVIRRQAGTLQKAILEGTMNAIEADSPTVRIEFQTGTEHSHASKLIIEDQGKGFRSEKEIYEWFETFGQPHTESEGKKWAEFRMGRGQLFAFGRNVWRTGTFQMTVDVEKMGLDYDLETSLPNFPGCRIEIDLYSNPLFYYKSIDNLRDAIKAQIEFIDATVVFNADGFDQQLNTPPADLKWDIETEDAYFMFGKGQDLAFYNMGALVMSQDAATAGVTGVVVSKQKLRVNFARNEVLHDCPVFERILAVVRENRIKKIRAKRRSLNRNERISLLRDLRDGIVSYAEIQNLNTIELSNDSMMSLAKIKQIRQPWTFAESGARVADRLLYQEQAVCFNDELLDELNYPSGMDQRDFFDWLLRAAWEADRRYSGNLKTQWQPMRKMYRPYAELAKGFRDVSRILPQGKWTKAERRIVRALESFDGWDGRAICIGTSDTNLAWTDGQSYICLAREYLQRQKPSSMWGASHVVTIMFHELAHDTSSEDTHHHGMEFYRQFHNILTGEHCPAYIMAALVDKLKKLRNEDWHEAQATKQTKAKKARDKKLGLTATGVAGEKAAIAAKPAKPVKVAKAKPRRRAKRF
jgi:hypothetical protein